MTIGIFGDLLKVAEQHIAGTTGEVDLQLLGPSCCGPNDAGQLLVETWDEDDDEPNQYVLMLHRDPSVDPDEHLDQVSEQFIGWLAAHGIAEDFIEVERASSSSQLFVSAQFDVGQWRSP